MYITKNKNHTVLLFTILYIVYFLFSAVECGDLKINPDLLLCLACVCPLFCGVKASAVLALVFGFLTDISVTPPAHLSPVLFLLCAMLLPKLTAGFSRVNAAVCAVCCVPLLLVRSITGFVYMASRFSGVGAFEMIKSTLIPELLLNFAGVIVTYFICAGLVRLLRLR